MDLEADDIIDIQHERLFRLSFLCLFFLYPVFSFFAEFLHIESSFLSIVARAIQLGTGLLYMAFLLRYGRFKLGSIQIIFFVVFWLIYSVRIVNDTLLHDRELGLPASQYYLFGILLSFLVILPFFAVAPIDHHKLEWQVFVLSFCLTLLGLYNALSNVELFIVRVGGNEKLNPISTALIAMLAVLVPVKRMLINKGGHFLQILLYILSISIGLATLLIVSTKIVFIVMALVLLLMIAYLFFKLNFKAIGGLTALFFVIVAVVIFGGFSEYFMFSFQRFDDIGRDESTQIRIDLIKGAFRQFQESPVFGSFLEERVYHFYPHNILLESLMAVGLFGSIFLFLFYFVFLGQTVSAMFKSSFSTLCIIALAQCLTAITSSSLSFSPEFWLAAAIISWLPLTVQKKEPPIEITGT